VVVKDQNGNVVPNALVWFNATFGGGSLDISNPVLTDINGIAQTTLTLGTVVGANTVTAEIAGNGIIQVLFTSTGNSDVPHTIRYISGNGQSEPVDSQLNAPFVVEVQDQHGNIVPNAAVWFNITNGDGSLSTFNPILTDNIGRAQTLLTVGLTTGSNTITAEISGKGTTQVIFIATGFSGVPEIVARIQNVELLEDDPPHTLSLYASAIDDENLPEELLWFITDMDESLYTISGQGTNVLIITPKPNQFGNDEVILWVVDEDGLKDSQSLWINITPVNDKPFFQPKPPDLTITKGSEYSFNYVPYIWDIDNGLDELQITADDSEHISVSGHRVAYLYPSSTTDKFVYVTLTLSDGIDDTQEVIRVNITEDAVPVLLSELPDITIYEGETKYDVFDLDDYFFDPDGDSIYFSYGYSHITIIIHENHSVDLHAESDWYGDEIVTFRARDPSYAISEDTIKVTVLPVNDPPSISGVPDLIVRYNATYVFDLSPYIIDADNSNLELSLSFREFSGGSWELSSYIHITEENNLKMVINYPDEFLGQTIPVRITVSDGIDMNSCEINIAVSEDWPPELLAYFPDVVFYEDETLLNQFNVNQYFLDRDDSTLFYTYGQVHVGITIHPDGGVDFYSDENWNGIENITIRATDPSGALVEDVIAVTVLPVNDAPIVEQIPDQVGYEGKTWVLDLRDFISDVDDHFSELVIICDSEYIAIIGTVLVFQYPEGVREETVRINVRDPSNANASTLFNVDVQKGTMMESNDDFFKYLWLFLLIVLLVIITVLLLLYKSSKFEVEEIFLVYNKTGILISRKHKGKGEEKDRDIMAELEDKKVMIENGEHTYLAAVFKGGSWRLGSKLKDVISDIELEYGDELENWKGVLEALEGVDVHLETLVKKEE
jgi:hypothetical protein